ncbi:hypothetical protein EJ110_NYTH09804 [Nymphaea thermarum]|nr:hypothetical protein EJ110_NYTH09804 [Nymphaea thermarum]
MTRTSHVSTSTEGAQLHREANDFLLECCDEQVKADTGALESPKEVKEPVNMEDLDFPNPTWDLFKEELLLRFGDTTYVNHEIELRNLKQTSTVQDYQTKFERLSSMVKNRPVESKIAHFIGGLNEDIQIEMLRDPPTELRKCYALARVIEEQFRRRDAQKKIHKTGFVSKPNANTVKADTGALESPKEVKEPVNMEDLGELGLGDLDPLGLGGEDPSAPCLEDEDPNLPSSDEEDLGAMDLEEVKARKKKENRGGKKKIEGENARRRNRGFLKKVQKTASVAEAIPGDSRRVSWSYIACWKSKNLSYNIVKVGGSRTRVHRPNLPRNRVVSATAVLTYQPFGDAFGEFVVQLDFELDTWQLEKEVGVDVGPTFGGARVDEQPFDLWCQDLRRFSSSRS